MHAINKKLENIIDNLLNNKKIYGAQFTVKSNNMLWNGACGNFETSDKFFIASTTKLFVTSLIFKLSAEKKLSLHDKVIKFIDIETLRGLSVYKNHDYCNEICINHLLSHSSGISDYFMSKDKQGNSLEKTLIIGNDCSWTFNECITMSKKLPSPFAFGSKNKAFYSDTNFQLLGKIIEVLYNDSIGNIFQKEIFDFLQMKDTYLYTDINDQQPKKIYYKKKQLYMPKAMVSFGPDGGAVSTSMDMLIFIEAFFNAKIFPTKYLNFNQQWNTIFFPAISTGIGYHRIKLPFIFDPLRKMPIMYGHSGLSGALAYYAPQYNIYIAGTINQINNPSISFQTMLRLVAAIK